MGRENPTFSLTERLDEPEAIAALIILVIFVRVRSLPLSKTQIIIRAIPQNVPDSEPITPPFLLTLAELALFAGVLARRFLQELVL